MKFFKKTSVAVLLTVLLIALCCVWGYSRVYEANPETNISTEHRGAGESNLNYYLDWIDDGAGLLSADTKDQIARKNLMLDNQYSSLLAIRTTNYLNGRTIQAYAEEAAETMELGSRDLLLVLDRNSQAWYVVYGGQLRSYVEQDGQLTALFQRYLGAGIFGEESDQRMLSLIDGLNTWYENHVPANTSTNYSIFPVGDKVQIISLGAILSGILFTLLANIWWILLLAVALNILDRVRFERYLARYPLNMIPPVPFRPILFWHQPGSRWYQRMMEQAFADGPDGPDGPNFEAGPGPGGPGGFDGGPTGPDGFGSGPDGFQAGPGFDGGGFQGGPGFYGPKFNAGQSKGRGLCGNLMGLAWEMSRAIGGTIRRFLRRL